MTPPYRYTGVMRSGHTQSEGQEMNTMTRAGFTAEVRNGVKCGARCYGRNHRDTATLGTCDGCGWDVAKTKDGRIMPVGNSYGYMRTYACWGAQHECDPKLAALYAAEKAEQIERGDIVKGQTVTVVKGRKVPKGTTGTVIWMGEDDWGNERVGIKTADGDSVFTAKSNVEATS